jgi:hypothetical protein
VPLVLVSMPLAADGVGHTVGVAAAGVDGAAGVDVAAGDDAATMHLVPLPLVLVAPLVSMLLLLLMPLVPLVSVPLPVLMPRQCWVCFWCSLLVSVTAWQSWPKSAPML